MSDVPALPSKFFALTDAAGLKSRLLVAISAAIFTRLAPSFVYAQRHDETPHPPPTDFLVQEWV
jgi:hypothetical protein